MSSPIRITQIGLGPLGQMLTPHLVDRSGIEIVSAVDIDPQKIGLDLGKVSKCDRSLGIPITDDLDQGLSNADLAVVTTVSELERIAPILKEIVSKGIDIVSTCEELSYPWTTQPELSHQIDAWAKENKASILGTGINPGFLMDFLPTAATGLCHQVESICIERIQDASFRRLPFRQKIGAGLTVEAFQDLVDQKKIRHVGLTESMHMIAARLGWTLDRTEDTVEPAVAQSDITGDDWTVPAGHAAGVLQIGRGFQGDREVLSLIFKAAVGQADPQECIHIKGNPTFDMVIPGGINGDVATCAVIANAIPVVANASPGLRTMVDLPPLSCAP